MSLAADLTPNVVPFVDTHMIGPLLDFLREQNVYDSKIISKEKIKVFSRTNLIDVIEEEYRRFPDDSVFQAAFNSQKPGLDERKRQIFELIDHEPTEVAKVSAFFSNASLIEEVRASNGGALPSEVLSSHGLSSEAVEAYYRHSKFKYECGMYVEAEGMLNNFLSISQPQSNSVAAARWGRLACRILKAKWDLALVDLAAVKESIDTRSVSPVDQIRQRAWALHWSLFIHINQAHGADAIADFFGEKNYLQTIENLCPWLLRYYAAFVVLSSAKRRVMLRDVLVEIQSMAYLYSDPITQFLDALLNQFDFEEAQRKLMECKEVLKNDFFLHIYVDAFVRECQGLMLETYCTLHRTVNFSQLAVQLHLSEEETEQWLVQAIMNSGASTTVGSAAAFADARLDSIGKMVIMGQAGRSQSNHFADKTRELTHRSAVLASSLLSMLPDQAEFIKQRAEQV